MNRKSFLFLAAGTLAAAAITGTALATDSREPSPARAGSSVVTTASADPTSGVTGDATPSTTPTPVPGASRTGPVGPDRAAEIAVAHLAGGTVVEVERELEHGMSVWSVKIVKDAVRHEVHVDARTGQVVRVEGASADDDRGRGGDDDRTTDDRGGDDDKGRDDHGRDDG